MPINHKHVRKYVGRINADVLAGWEAGMKGKQKVGGALFHRQAPIHLIGSRLADWEDGRDGAAKLLASRFTHFSGTSATGEVKIRRKGWLSSAARWATVKLMWERHGAGRDINVHYTEDGEIIRSTCCSS